MIEKRTKDINILQIKQGKLLLNRWKDLNLTHKSNENKNSTEIPFLIRHTSKYSKVCKTLCWQGCGETGTHPWQVVIRKCTTLMVSDLGISHKIAYVFILRSRVYESILMILFNKCKENMQKVIHCSIFVIAQDWKPPKCPSTEACLNKRWYIPQMECYALLR